MRGSGEKFRRPGGVSGSGKGGEIERRGRAFIVGARGRNGQCSKGEMKGELTAARALLRRNHRLEEEESVGADTRVPPVSRGERERGYRFGFDFLGRGLDLELGQIVSLGAFSIFISFLLFLFLFSLFLP
jgi:hypothetical protein